VPKIRVAAPVGDLAHSALNGGTILRSRQFSHHKTTNSLPSAAFPAIMLDVVVRTGRPTERYGASLDNVSKAIIEELQKDGRKPYAAIGKVVGLSEAAVRQRVQRLLDHGVMQIVAVTDPLELGFARQALIGIRAEGDLEVIADELANMVELEYVVITAGSFDILAEVVCESDEQLLEILSKRIRSIPGVRITESFVYLKLRKQTYSWGVR
jgi:Lrp/AsnC family transcriptional regulator for asnA, asnC and gidA